MHKSQGVIIGPGNYRGDVVVTLPTKHIRTQSGMDLVEFYMATSKETFSVWDDDVIGVTVEDLKGIGHSKAYDECRNFENML